MDTSTLPPADAAVALRSFPRRYRAATALRKDEIAERMLEQPGPDGRSVVELAVDTVRSLALLDRALEQTLVTDRPALHPAVVDRSLRTFDAAAHGHLDDVLAELDDAAPALAERIEAVPAEDWVRPATIAGRDDAIRAIDIAQEAVATGADNLHAVERTVRGFRAG